ncbi:MAG: hypothetical protein V1709_02780 [Planctomycetota bacterium]
MNKWSGLAIKSFIFGLLGWLIPMPLGILLKMRKIEFATEIQTINTIITLITLLLWLFAILLGIRSLRNIKSNPTQKGKVFAILGIILGVIAILSWVGIIVGILIQ